MLEYGIEQEYFEIWERMPNSVGHEHVDVQFEPTTTFARPARDRYCLRPATTSSSFARAA